MEKLEYEPCERTVHKAIKVLKRSEEKLFTAAVNLLMLGKMRDVSDCFEEGDDFTFFPEHFEDSGDANLELIDKTIKKNQTTLASIQNLNGIEGRMK
ncbi:MAG: hypothetical protein WCY77_00535 [Weeksellaceae bacterium]